MCTFLGIFTLEKAVFWCLTGQNGGLLDLVDLCDGAEDVGPRAANSHISLSPPQPWPGLLFLFPLVKREWGGGVACL